MNEPSSLPPNNPYTSPVGPGGAPQMPNQPYPSQEGDGTGGVIPYKNPHALIAYYLGLFSLFPCLGLALAIPAFILGIMGLRARKRNPAIRGSVHAWIGIVMGGIFTVIWGLMGLAIIGGLIAENMNP
jgi:hypothetical protein